MYKLIFIDLDGTLLDDNKEVSKENIEMINKAYNEKGVISVVTTGRPYICAEHIGKKVGECFTNYIISSTGGDVRDNKKGIKINKKVISNENTLEVLKLVDKYNLESVVDVGETLLRNRPNKNIEIYERIGQPYRDVESLTEHVKNGNFCSGGITFSAAEEVLVKLIKELENIENVEPTSICKYKVGINEKTYIDIIPKGVTKENAITMVASYLGVNKEEIIVIGDGRK